MTERLQRWLPAGLLIAALAIVGGALAAHDAAMLRPPPVRAIDVSGTTVRAEIVRSQQRRSRGLLGRESLAANAGMLFVYPRSAHLGIWMKEMRFPIDILWLSDDGIIVDMRENVSPETYPTAFRPERPARYVLELPAHFAASHGIRIGDKVRF